MIHQIDTSTMTKTGLMSDGLFPKKYQQLYDQASIMLGPTVPLDLYSGATDHPLCQIIRSMLSLAACKSLAFGYSGGGYGIGGGSSGTAEVLSELVGFINGWRYCGVVHNADLPDRYKQVVHDYVHALAAVSYRSK